ncbi:hypothetical protein HRbin15_01210 [bacterium HR15]|nr:hypothetical protein HRbin15_01210 [bacterium HR15]
MRHSRHSSRSGGQGETSHWIAPIAFLVVIALLLAVGWWFWHYSREQELRLPLRVGAAFDISGSMQKAEKQRAVGVLYALIDEKLPYQTPIRIWVYAERIHESTEQAPTRSSDLNAFAQRSITEKLGEWGTYQKLPLQAMLNYAKEYPDRKMVLCLFTDGEDHTPAETQHLAAELSRLPNVCAVLVGPLEEQFRMGFRHRLEALRQSGKLILFGKDDAGRALDELKAKLDQLDREVRDK